MALGPSGRHCHGRDHDSRGHGRCRHQPGASLAAAASAFRRHGDRHRRRSFVQVVCFVRVLPGRRRPYPIIAPKIVWNAHEKAAVDEHGMVNEERGQPHVVPGAFSNGTAARQFAGPIRRQLTRHEIATVRFGHHCR